MALAFAHQQYFMTSVIIGATTMDQLNSDLEAFEMKLSSDLLKQIETIRRDFPIPY